DGREESNARWMAGTSGWTRTTVTRRSGDRLRRLLQHLGVVGALPREVAVAPAEVTVRRGVAVDRPSQVETLDDRGGAEDEHVAHEAGPPLGIDMRGAARSGHN